MSYNNNYIAIIGGLYFDSGSFGVVYKATLTNILNDDQLVAVKVARSKFKSFMLCSTYK